MYAMSSNDETILERWLVRLEKSLASNNRLTQKALNEAKGAHEQSKQTNGKLAKIREEVDNIQDEVSAIQSWRSTFKNQPDPNNLPSPWKDPQIIRLTLMVVLVIVLGLTGIRIAGLSL